MGLSRRPVKIRFCWDAVRVRPRKPLFPLNFGLRSAFVDWTTFVRKREFRSTH